MLKLQARLDSLGFGPAIRHGGLQWSTAVGWICLIWYTTVVAVCILGYFQMYVLDPF
jgi:ceramide glucosyltransferase